MEKREQVALREREFDYRHMFDLFAKLWQSESVSNPRNLTKSMVISLSTPQQKYCVN